MCQRCSALWQHFLGRLLGHIQTVFRFGEGSSESVIFGGSKSLPSSFSWQGTAPVTSAEPSWLLSVRSETWNPECLSLGERFNSLPWRATQELEATWER